MPTTKKGKIVRATLERFPDVSSLAVSRYLINEYGEVFDHDIQKARELVRYHRGLKKGGHNFTPLPVRHNIKPPQTQRTLRTPYDLSPGLWLTFADVHVPFHEMKPIEAMIKHAQTWKIDGIFIDGDFQDCEAASFWMPTKKRNFDLEIEATIDMFDFINAELKPKKRVYKPGNHEDRLPRLFANKMPEIGMSMGGIVAQTEVLGFESRQIEYLDSLQVVMAGKLPIFHGHELRYSSVVNPARGLFLKLKSWGMTAHSHRSSEHTETNLAGTVLTTWSIGCLCNLSPDYFPYANNWNWGFALVNVEKDGNFEVVNKRVLPSGVVV